VFVHKAATDVSWLACADAILNAGGALYGQFASHNAHSLCALIALARGRDARDFEIQRLYGMGAALSDVLAQRYPSLPQRVYAPVGAHHALLPYLMRRLLENGANSSFVHHLSNPEVPIAELVRDPRELLPSGASRPPAIPLPRELYAPARRNSRGINLDDERVLCDTVEAIARLRPRGQRVRALIGGVEAGEGEPAPLRAPFDTGLKLGELVAAGPRECEHALGTAAAAFDAWRRTPVEERAACL